MIEKTGAIDVYFEDEIEILVREPDGFPIAAVEEILSAREIGYSRIEKKDV